MEKLIITGRANVYSTGRVIFTEIISIDKSTEKGNIYRILKSKVKKKRSPNKPDSEIVHMGKMVVVEHTLDSIYPDLLSFENIPKIGIDASVLWHDGERFISEKITILGMRE